MDPPTSSSSSSRIKQHQHHEGPVTPKSRNTNSLSRSPRPPFFVESSPHKYHATKNSPRSQRTSAMRLHRSRNVAKIIKGEIHNVLTVMRSDPRYYTTGGGGPAVSRRSRFDYEERQHVAGMGAFWGSSDRGMMRTLDDSSNANLTTTMGSFAAHPILQGLRDLYDTLSSMESECFDRSGDGDVKLPLSAARFVAPFAAAVSSADVDAKTTGAALSALHKFIVYGFLEGRSSSEDIRESITIVARCIPQCSFEETSKRTSGSKSMISFWSSNDDKQKNGSSFMLKQPTDDKTSYSDIPRFLLQPRRGKSTKGNSGSKHPALSSDDENVVLKLLSLSVQVLRCSAGRSYLSPSDIVAIFDTCLFVTLASEEVKHSLLRSAAADALSHCVIVLFGMRADRVTSRRNEPFPDEDTADPTTEDGSDSDDEWGDRDPSLDVESYYLLKRLNVNNSTPDDKQQSQASRVESHPENVVDDTNNEGDEPAFVTIMARLATIADPLVQEDDTCVLSLSLINIALETMNDIDSMTTKYPRLLSVMQSDLSRNLLRLSTSSDLTLLGLGLRVIFNLFNGLKQNMKVQLEVFLTSVHLRMLSSSRSPTTHQQVWSSSPEHRELALESLLEFCREPMLMMDLYLNYDCDINCTNLFETICITLATVANPDDELEDDGHTQGGNESKKVGDSEVPDVSHKPRLNILNRLAIEGLLAVIEFIANRCRASSKFPMVPFGIVDSIPESSPLHNFSKPCPPDSGNSDILGNMLCINGLVREAEDYYDYASLSSSSDIVTPDKRVGYTNVRTNSDISDLDFEAITKTRHHTTLALRERKLQKRRLAKATSAFNDSSRDKEWIAELERLGVVSSPATPVSIATFLYSASEKLDKAKVGEYISKGPKEKYPFIEKVLHEFTRLFDFTGMSFSEALRLFLSTFRLPGEAQCIDRLMEAFAQRLYESQAKANQDENAEKTMLDPPRVSSEGENNSRSGLIDPPTSDDTLAVLPFQSSDAAFILAFSTIMLNTDLHNPNMDDAKRMTLEQFIRNNRGINDGTDLPVDFLEELYNDIKHNEIQMKKDISCENVDDFDGLLVERGNVTAPFITSSNATNKFSQAAGVHEKDMFVAISLSATRALASVYVQSWDDFLVMKALNGLRSAAHICAYFGLTREFNEIVSLLLSWGQDYVESVAKIQSSDTCPEEPRMTTRTEEVIGASNTDKLLDCEQLNSSLALSGLPPLPTALVSSLNADDINDQQLDADNVAGTAAHRGLMSLLYALVLCKNHLTALNEESLPVLLEVIFSLRGVDALPSRLNDLDDFADSKGNALLPSAFAVQSLERMKAYKESLSTKPKPSNSGLLSMFSFGKSHPEIKPADRSSPLITVLKAVSDTASMDQIIMKMNDVNMAKRFLSSMLAVMFPDDNEMVHELCLDATYEYNAVFVLELAARLLISNRAHSAELVPIFVSKFEALFAVEEGDNMDASILGLKFPFLLERIVVTILRAEIHLFDTPNKKLRNHLVRAMNYITRLPSWFTKEVSNRLGCGSAIVLRGCFLFFEGPEEWAAIRDALDIAAQHEAGRSFVFDGIASLVEYVFPAALDGDHAVSNDIKLSPGGCEALRFLLLKFLEGSYDNDFSYKLPAMMYMKRVYSRQNSSSDSSTSCLTWHGQERAQDTGIEWYKMVSIIYKDVCMSDDVKASRKGYESLHEVVLSTQVDSITDDRWLALLHMTCKNPPPATLQMSRMDSLTFIGRLFLTLMPGLSSRKENWAQLEDLTLEVAEQIRENLRSGRSTPLFEVTVQIASNICNVMSLSGFNNGQGINFCSWVGETLLCELEKVGACGGVDSSVIAAGSTSV